MVAAVWAAVKLSRAGAMRRRNGAAVQTGVLLLAALALAVGPAAVAGVSVAQACVEVSCFSGVVAACGSCLPAQADAVSGRPHLILVGLACTQGGGASPQLPAQCATKACDRARDAIIRHVAPTSYCWCSDSSSSRAVCRVFHP